MAKRRYPVKTVFVDSSVLFTAVNSPSGGSAKLFTLKGLELETSPLVLVETERNVRNKLHSYHVERFFTLAAKLTIINQLPNDERIEEAKKVIAKKDAAILAEAKQAKTNMLATLDRKHFFTNAASEFLQPQKVVTPKMIIEIMEKEGGKKR